MSIDNKPVFAEFDNGLEVVNITNSTLNTMFIGFLSGTRDDPEWLEGAAHATEHLMCRGANPRTAARILARTGSSPVTEREMNRVYRRYLGGTHDSDIRVHTMHSYTAYGHADLLYRRYRKPVFRAYAGVVREGMYALRRMDHDKTILDLHNFRIEVPAVDNETGLNNDDSAIIAMKTAMELLYTTNPVRRWGDANPEQLAKIKLGRLKGWAQQHYVPRKMRVIMLGPDQNTAIRMVRESGLDQIPDWKPALPAVQVVDPNDITPVLTEVRERVIERPGTRMTHVYLLWPTETFLTGDSSALEVLARLMDGVIEDETREQNTRLPGGVYHPETGWDVSSTHGCLSSWIATRGGRDHADELTDRTLTCLNGIKENTSTEFEEDVRDVRDNLVDSFISTYRYAPDALADQILSHLANGDEDLSCFSAYKANLAAVTPEDVRRAAAKYLTADRYVRTVVQPA